MENVKELADFWTNVYLGLNSYDQENIFGLRSKDLRKCALQTAKVLLDINAPNRHKSTEDLKEFDGLRYIESDGRSGFETEVEYSTNVIRIWLLVPDSNKGTINAFYGQSAPLVRKNKIDYFKADGMSLFQIKRILEGYGFKCQ